MRTNNVVAKMLIGEKAYGCSLTFPSTALVELMGQAGLDHVSFDSEHGPFSTDIIDDLCRVAPNDAEDFPAPNDTLSGHVLAEQDI